MSLKIIKLSFLRVYLPNGQFREKSIKKPKDLSRRVVFLYQVCQMANHVQGEYMNSQFRYVCYQLYTDVRWQFQHYLTSGL